nr:glycerol-3-phosphate dehydrogenase [Gammaproteobacteria bacterium]
DLWVDDARLVILNILEAVTYGACVNKNTSLELAEYNTSLNLWEITLSNCKKNNRFNIQAKCIINATGPWVNSVLENNLKLSPKYNIRLIKGSHIVVPKLDKHLHGYAYVLQNTDNRIIFAIPYEKDFTLIGTTESEEKLSKEKLSISKQEIDYLLYCYNHYFKTKLQVSDIKYTYSGIRPLFYQPNTNSSENTRDYKLDIYSDKLPLISIYGGKITTYRVLASNVIKILTKINLNFNLNFNLKINSDKQLVKLPGGDLEASPDKAKAVVGYSRANHQAFVTKLLVLYPWLSQDLAERYTRTYGSLVYKFLKQCKSQESLGYHFGSGLYQCEVDYLVNNEYADCVEDVLFRRTKLGLYLSIQQTAMLKKYLENC